MKPALKSRAPAAPVRPGVPMPPAAESPRQRPARRGAFWPGESFGQSTPAPLKLALSIANLAVLLPMFGPGRH